MPNEPEPIDAHLSGQVALAKLLLWDPVNARWVKARADTIRNAQGTGTATVGTGQGPMVDQDYWAAAIDATNKWTTTVSGTATMAVSTNAGRRIALGNTVAASQRSELLLKKILTNPGVSSPTRDIQQQFVMEWEMLFGTLANIDNANTHLGLINSGTGRSDADLIGFMFAANALNCITDTVGVETVSVFPSPPTLTNFNKYKIVVRNAAVDFYVNDVLGVARTANIPALPFQPNFRIDSNAGGATRFELGWFRCYYMDS